MWIFGSVTRSPPLGFRQRSARPVASARGQRRPGGPATVCTVPIIDVFADVVCPFTHLSLRRIVDQRAQLEREDLTLRIRAWPLQLVNGEPISCELVSEEIEQLQREVAPDLFTGFDPSSWPMTSMPSFALVAEAYRQGEQCGERMSLALRTELFEKGRDISDPNVLGELAAEEGIEVPDLSDESAARRDWDAGKDRGVQGSPHYFIGDDDFFCPSFDIKRVDDELRIYPDPEGFQEFVDRVLR